MTDPDFLLALKRYLESNPTDLEVLAWKRGYDIATAVQLIKRCEEIARHFGDDLQVGNVEVLKAS